MHKKSSILGLALLVGVLAGASVHAEEPAAQSASTDAATAGDGAGGDLNASTATSFQIKALSDAMERNNDKVMSDLQKRIDAATRERG